MESPRAPWRPWPTCSGPVGLAETNSTITHKSLSGLRPKASPAASTSATTACLALGFKRRLMKPGPAISSWSTQRCTASRRCSAVTSAVASSRGFFLSARDSCMATVIARSPCEACLGDSNAGVRAASGASSATASRSAASRSCLAWIMGAILRRHEVTSRHSVKDWPGLCLLFGAPPSAGTADDPIPTMSAELHTDHPPLPTQIGKYRVLKKLGEGATSEAFLARDEFHGRDVALKR